MDQLNLTSPSFIFPDNDFSYMLHHISLISFLSIQMSSVEHFDYDSLICVAGKFQNLFFFFLVSVINENAK